MTGGIYLLQPNEELVKMEEKEYDSESLLQTLLAKYHDLLGGDQMNSEEPRRFVLIKRELGIPSGETGGDRFSLDHLFLDQDGIPTLVEVKRSSDTRLRREVVGQMLDYAANIVAHWPVNSVVSLFEQRCIAEGVEPREKLEEDLGDSIDYDEFWERVRTNFLAKKLRLLFVADRIPAELRRVVEFLNETMDPVEVLAVEIRQYGGQDQKALVPRVIGQTSDAQQRKGRRGRTNRDEFLSSWSEPTRTFFGRILDLVGELKLLVNWGEKGFSLNVVLDGKNVSILEGYPPEVSHDLYMTFRALRMKVANPEPIEEWSRGEVEKLSGTSATAGGNLRCLVDDVDAEKADALIRILRSVARKIREHGLAS